MKVVCDNCRAVYRVPDTKLTKAVNKATCRNCGHRMLIPRPKPGADPEERTLVTAVPPTPPGAPPRDEHRGGGHTRPVPEDDNESTLPGRQPDDLHMGTPNPVDRHPDDFDGPSTVVSDGPPGLPSYGRDPSQSTTLVQAPPANGRQTPARSGAAPAPRRTPMPAAPRRTPGPTLRRNTPLYTATGAAPHDPSSDLNWALFGSGAALLGAFFLAFLSVYNHALLMWFGLALAFGGGVLTFGVLLTGGRGRHPAKTLMSVVAGFIVALIMSTAMVATKLGAEVAIDALEDINFAAPPNVVDAQPVEPAKPAPADAQPAPAPTDGSADAGEPVAPAPDPAPEPAKPETKPKPGDTKPPEPKPAPVPAPAPARPTPAPAPAPVPAPPAPGEMHTVPTGVVHVMVSNNLDVKKCFVPMFKAGTLPPRIDVSFFIQPSGAAQRVAVKNPPTLRSSEIEMCLQSAIARIAFPPTTGTGTPITYPFALK
jgi:predicted Zn finger-like uncharacterized protein